MRGPPLRKLPSLRFLGAYGTIGPVKQYRIRLTTDDLDLIVAALSARYAGLSAVRRYHARELMRRLAEPEPGNPRWRFGVDGEAYLVVQGSGVGELGDDGRDA